MFGTTLTSGSPRDMSAIERPAPGSSAAAEGAPRGRSNLRAGDRVQGDDPPTHSKRGASELHPSDSGRSPPTHRLLDRTELLNVKRPDITKRVLDQM